MKILHCPILLLILASLVVTASGRTVTPVKDKSLSWMDTIFQKFLTSFSSTAPEKTGTQKDTASYLRKDQDAASTVEPKERAISERMTTYDLTELPATTTSSTPSLSTSTNAPTTTEKTTTKALPQTLPFSMSTTRLKSVTASTSSTTTTIQKHRKDVSTTHPVDRTRPLPPYQHIEELYVINRTIVDDVQKHCRYGELEFSVLFKVGNKNDGHWIL